MDFDQALKEIDQAYYSLGHSQYEMGYRFLLTTRENFTPETDIVLLSQNPGGDFPIPDHPYDSCENGPAHLTESWKSNPPSKDPLQIQVQRLFHELSNHIPGNHNLIYEALMAYFIPFRTPELKKLHSKTESIEFSLTLWTKILTSIQPKLILCLGNIVYQNVQKIYADQLLKSFPSENFYSGQAIGKVLKYKNGLRILKLPHLSRFKIFSRHECKEPINRLLEQATENW